MKRFTIAPYKVIWTTGEKVYSSPKVDSIVKGFRNDPEFQEVPYQLTPSITVPGLMI